MRKQRQVAGRHADREGVGLNRLFHVVHRRQRALGDQAEGRDGRREVGEGFLVQHALFHAGQRAVQLFGGVVNPPNEPERRPRHFLQIERLPADHFVAVIQHLRFVPARDDRHVLIAQETHRVDGEDCVGMDPVALPDLQKHNDVRAFRRQFGAGHVADLNAGHQDGGFALDASDVGRPEAERVSRREQRQALAEVQHQQAEQPQAEQDEQPDFPFQSPLFHIKNAVPSDRKCRSQNDRPAGPSTEQSPPACR